MQLNSEVMSRVRYLVGSEDSVLALPDIPAQSPFNDGVIAFLNDLSRTLMSDKQGKAYPDVVTFGFWIRRSSVLKLMERFIISNENQMGRGVVFHIAPSNVPVNFAYSLVAGLITGNANVVRVPSKEFPQISIITEAIIKNLEAHEEVRPYIICVRYEKDREVNDFFSSLTDMRIVWGGDNTIAELRKSPLPPRSGEITFANRYSLSVIDSDTYLKIEDKLGVAEGFYNDTYLFDQNACTSPRIIIWTGNRKQEAQELFWEYEHEQVLRKYTFQDIMAVNKLTSAYRTASCNDVKLEHREDNLIVRIKVNKITEKLMDDLENSGFFYEYNCDDIMEIRCIVNDRRCQTIGYIGNKTMFRALIESGVKGIDRIVPIGKTMDFDLIWDGYDLVSILTRRVSMI